MITAYMLLVAAIVTAAALLFGGAMWAWRHPLAACFIVAVVIALAYQGHQSAGNGPPWQQQEARK